MTDLVLTAVGRARPGPERQLFDHYQGRLRPALSVIEVEEKRPLPTDVRKAREGERLLAHVPAGAILVALDERGQSWSTQDFARALKGWLDDARSAVIFTIGGADGHASAVLDRADIKLSFGRLTWPHMLVRALVAEQVYRAQCIFAGHPYHRE